MALRIDIVGAKPIPRHESPALPVSVPVPNRREAIEALGRLRELLRNEKIDECLDTLYRFVLTR